MSDLPATRRAPEPDPNAPTRISDGPTAAVPPPSSPTSDADVVGLPDEVAALVDDPRARIGRHVLVSEIGRGGMGVVYRAFDLELRRTVAIKTVLQAEREGSAGRQRFAQEARAAAKLRHPSIVALHEVGEHEGRAFLVMDFIEGRGLDELLRAEGARPPREAATLVRELALALDHAHEHGVVHRDVKPANVLIDAEDGRPLLTDFGLAQERDAAAAGITRSGAFLGTPGYAPPEQVAGDLDRIGPRSDVYAAGALLYHLLAGRAPFHGAADVNVVLASLRDEPTSLRTANRGVHRDLETIALRCLEKDPARRYAAAADLAADLGRFLAGEPIAARPVGRAERAVRWCRRQPARASALALAVALVLAVPAFLIVQRASAARERADAARSERDRIVRRARRDLRLARKCFVEQRHVLAAGGLSPEAAQEQTDYTLARGVEALEASSRLVTLLDAEDARTERFEVAMELGESALAAGQWSIASSAFKAAGDLGVDDAAAAAALERVADARARKGIERQKAVERILRDARSGELGRRPDGWDDALFELVGYRDAATVARLAAELDALSSAMRAASLDVLRGVARASAPDVAAAEAAIDSLAEVAPGERLAPGPAALIAALGDQRLGLAQRRRVGEDGLRTAALCAEALGRIGIADGAVAPLARYLWAEEDGLRATVPAIALCRLGSDEAERVVLASRLRHGEQGDYWRTVARYVEAERTDPAGVDGD